MINHGILTAELSRFTKETRTRVDLFQEQSGSSDALTADCPQTRFRKTRCLGLPSSETSQPSVPKFPVSIPYGRPTGPNYAVTADKPGWNCLDSVSQPDTNNPRLVVADQPDAGPFLLGFRILGCLPPIPRPSRPPRISVIQLIRYLKSGIHSL